MAALLCLTFFIGSLQLGACSASCRRMTGKGGTGDGTGLLQPMQYTWEFLHGSLRSLVWNIAWMATVDIDKPWPALDSGRG